MFEDKTLVCKECGNEFVFTAGEQEFYAERGFQNEPQRCKPCRDARKNATRGPSSPSLTVPCTAASASLVCASRVDPTYCLGNRKETSVRMSLFYCAEKKKGAPVRQNFAFPLKCGAILGIITLI